MNEMLGSLVTSLDLRDPGTHVHAQRTTGYALIIGRLLGLSKEELLTLEQGVFLHDIGKIHIPDRILKKPERLSESEWKVMKSHAVTGYAMLSSIPSLREAAAIVLAHHERYDGTGYPHRLRSEEIPLGARICAVADCLDTLTAPDRPYRRPLSFAEACRHIETQRGKHFDPIVVDGLRSLSPSQWRQLAVSIARPPIRRMDRTTDLWLFREAVFNRCFDKVSAKVVAC